MAIFQDLELDKFYLVKMSENDNIRLVQVAMATEKCVLVYEFGEVDITYWKKKDEYISEVVEELTDESIDEYETLLLEEYDEEEFTNASDTHDYLESDEDNKKKMKKKKKKK